MTQERESQRQEGFYSAEELLRLAEANGFAARATPQGRQFHSPFSPPRSPERTIKVAGKTMKAIDLGAKGVLPAAYLITRRNPINIETHRR